MMTIMRVTGDWASSGRTFGTRDELAFAPVRARFVGLRITASTNQTLPVLTNLTVPNS